MEGFFDLLLVGKLHAGQVAGRLGGRGRCLWHHTLTGHLRHHLSSALRLQHLVVRVVGGDDPDVLGMLLPESMEPPKCLDRSRATVRDLSRRLVVGTEVLVEHG